MKLMSATQVEEKRKASQASEALRVARLNEQMTNKSHQLNVLDSELAAKRTQIEEETTRRCDALMAKVSALQAEVTKLERQRKAALEPLDNEKRELVQLRVERAEHEQRLKAQDRALERTRTRLTRLGDRLEDREDATDAKELSLNERMETIVAREFILQKSEATFNQKFTQAQKDFENRQKELDEKEKVLTAGMEWVSRREETLKTEQAQMEEQRKKLQATELRLGKHYQNLKAKGLIK